MNLVTRGYKNYKYIKLTHPRSLLSRIPLVIIDNKIRFGFIFDTRPCFILYIRVPFFMVKWGPA